MRIKLTAILKFCFGNFGPLILFYGVNHYFSLKPAIAFSTLFSLGEIAYKKYRGQKIASLFKFSAGITLILGVFDLYAKQPVFFRYESTITNVITGLFFVGFAFAEKSPMQEFYEQRKDARAVTPDLASFFRFLTFLWAGYFFAKAAVYFWMAGRFSLEEGLLIRTVVGNGSLFALIGLSVVGSGPLFRGMKKMGFFRQR